MRRSPGLYGPTSPWMLAHKGLCRRSGVFQWEMAATRWFTTKATWQHWLEVGR
jgi:hypothetical protein